MACIKVDPLKLHAFEQVYFIDKKLLTDSGSLRKR